MSGGSKNVYASVKSYSKRGKLLGRSDFQTLSESRNLDELVTRIRNTVYGEVVADVAKPYTSHGIESALRGHLASVHHGISKTVGGGGGLLDAYYAKFLIFNLKQILKGKVLAKPQAEIESHINLRAEELIKQRDTTVKALVAKDLEEAVASLNQTEFGEDAAKAAALYSDKKNLQIFDTYFDKILISRLVKVLKSGDIDAAKLVEMDIDFYNILCVIRGKFWGLDDQHIHDMIVVQSPAARDLLTRMISAATIRDIFNELSATKYKELIPQIEGDGGELDAIAIFERDFEMAIYRASLNSFTKMFSLATIVGITKLTAFEVRNLAAIAYAVEQQIPAETTMSRLIVGEQ